MRHRELIAGLAAATAAPTVLRAQLAPASARPRWSGADISSRIVRRTLHTVGQEKAVGECRNVLAVGQPETLWSAGIRDPSGSM
jgi:hypothetical protein